MCIRAHDVRMDCASQHTYRLGIANKFDADLRPNFLSVHVLRCIYFAHTTNITKKMKASGWGWMLNTNVVWHGMSPLPWNCQVCCST